jgi:hypothetical protein
VRFRAKKGETPNQVNKVFAMSVHTVATAPGKPPPWDWRILINGFADQILYERGDLIGEFPFADLRRKALINEKAKSADQDPEFSRRIRESRVGF